MKSTQCTDCCEKREKPFPKLMRSYSTGCIILMQAPSGGDPTSDAINGRGRGVIVHGESNNGNKVGEYVDKWWPMSSFYDYEGVIQLTNDGEIKKYQE